MNIFIYYKKFVCVFVIYLIEYSFVSVSLGGNNIKKWKCLEGIFVNNFVGYEVIINILSINLEGVLFFGGKLYFLLCGLFFNYY